MDRASRSVNLAGVVAFVIGFVEFGGIGEGIVWAIEDGLGLSHWVHVVSTALVALAAFAFAVYSARRARRFQASQIPPAQGSDS